MCFDQSAGHFVVRFCCDDDDDDDELEEFYLYEVDYLWNLKLFL